jgi:hypothetical protein
MVIGGAAYHILGMTNSLARHPVHRYAAAAIDRWDADGGAAEFSRGKPAATGMDPSSEIWEASSRLKSHNPPMEENALGFIGADEAALWQDVTLDDFMGTTHLERGVYRVSVLHNEEGEEDGVQLRRTDVPGPMISLSQDQYVTLENLPFFEKR